jgi:hypothetical protein
MIVVECNADELFIEKMGFGKKVIHHAGCKGEVLKKVRKQTKTKAVGIIDEDPNSEQPGELRKYKPTDEKGAIKLLEARNNKDKALIQISPDLEHWLLKRAKENKINPKDLSLPNTAKGLHSLTRIKRNTKFIDFLNRLNHSDSEIKVMKEWIKKALN